MRKDVYNSSPIIRYLLKYMRIVVIIVQLTNDVAKINANVLMVDEATKST